MRFRAQAGLSAAAALCALPAALAPRHAAGQGFGLAEIGSCAIARGLATTGAPCDDASALYWNPAAAARLDGLSAYGGVTGIRARGSFTQDVTRREHVADVPVELPPFVGVNWTRSGPGARRLALGVAAYVPYGLSSRWRDDFPGRFSAQRAWLRTIYVQPNVALDLVPGRLALGAGVVVARSSLELRQALDFSRQPAPGSPGTRFAQLGFQPGTEFARARVRGSGTGWGYHVGAHARPARWLSAGARYLSEVRVDYEDADAQFDVSPLARTYVLPAGNALRVPAGTTLEQIAAPLFAGAGALRPGQTVGTRIDHPAQLQVGVGLTPLPGTTLSADYARTYWSSFAGLPLRFGAGSPLTRAIVQEYVDVSAYRAGLEHRFGDRPLGGLLAGVAGRVGFGVAESPAPAQTVTPLLPDMDRYNFSVGAGIPIGGRFALDAAYLRVETAGRRGRTVERPDGATPEEAVGLNDGWFALAANVFSLSMRAQF